MTRALLRPCGPGAFRLEALHRTLGPAVARTAPWISAVVVLGLLLGAGASVERRVLAMAKAHVRDAAMHAAEPVARALDATVTEALMALAHVEGQLVAGRDPLETAQAGGAHPLLRAVAAQRADGAPRVAPQDDPSASALAALTDASAHPRQGLRAAAGMASLLIWRRGDAAAAAAALDLDALRAVLATDTPADGLRRALVIRGPAGAALVLGDREILRADPVLIPLAPPAATLALAVAPADGWQVPAGLAFGVRLATFGAAALALAALAVLWPGAPRRQAAPARGRPGLPVSRRIALALDASGLGVWEHEIGSDAWRWDARTRAIYGLAADGRDPTLADWLARVHPEDRARAHADVRAALQQMGTYVSEFRLQPRDGALRHVRAVGTVCFDGDGSAHLLGLTWDVTAEAAQRAELEAGRDAAEAAAAAMSRFLATMSHEIRTPLNGVLGMLDLLLRTPLLEDQRARAEVARDSAGHLLSVLNDILDHSKLEAQRVALEPEPVEVRALVRDITALLSGSAELRGLRLEAHMDPGLPSWLECDATRLRQVLLNLICNAMKFTDEGRVDVFVRYRAARPGSSGGMLAFEVRDTGIGIPEDDRRRLFERFVQVDTAATRQRGGAGLGLAISRQLVELMGGEISVESMPDRGSTFRFWIRAEPCPAPIAMPAVPLTPLPRPGQAGPLRILLAEDNATNQHILSAYLALDGHSVRVVENGLRAVEAAATEPYDLILMDIQMPDMDGISATRLIRALPPPARTLPIIALTAHAMKGDRERYLDVGMTDYISKPVTADALLATVRRVTAPEAEAPTACCA